MSLVIGEFVARWEASPFGAVTEAPWRATQTAEALVWAAAEALGGDYRIADGVAVHASARVEPGAVVKAPAIIGPRCFVAATAYLRGGVFMDEDRIVGPAPN